MSDIRETVRHPVDNFVRNWEQQMLARWSTFSAAKRGELLQKYKNSKINSIVTFLAKKETGKLIS